MKKETQQTTIYKSDNFQIKQWKDHYWIYQCEDTPTVVADVYGHFHFRKDRLEELGKLIKDIQEEK